MAKKTKQLGDGEIRAIIARQLALSEDHDNGDSSKDRAKRLEYFQGKLNDITAEKGRSSVVSRDFADTVNQIMPGLMRVFATTDSFCEFQPVEPEDEDFAEQASDGVNHIFLKKNDGYKIIYDGCMDALTQKNAIIKVYWDDTPTYKTSFHEGLSAEDLALLESDPEVEILAQTDSMTEIQTVDEMGNPVIEPVATYDVKVQRIKENGCIRVECIPREDYGNNEGATGTGPDKALFESHKDEKTRSDLLAMGFDEKKVAGLPVDSDNTLEEAARDEDSNLGDHDSADTSTETVDLYECYFKADVDGDGQSEYIQAYYAGSTSGGVLLDWNVWEDEGVFYDIQSTPMPHRFEGNDIFDRTEDIQQVKSVLLRQGLDSLYGSNIPTRQAVAENVLNATALSSPEFGATIWLKDGSQPVMPLEMPNVAADAFGVLDYMDQVNQRRTGVSRQTAALDSEALVNQSATANQNEQDAAYAQVEQIARNMAWGWAKVMKAILRLMIKYQDKASTIRMRNEWVDIDPRHWNADMDVTVNVGLGSGSKERDTQILGVISQQQQMTVQNLVQGGMMEKALEMAPMMLKTQRQMVESAGLRNPEQYFPEITDQELAQAAERIAQNAGQPSPEEQKIIAEQQIAQQKHQMDMQAAEMQAQVARDKEEAQMQADLVVNEAKQQIEVMRLEMDRAIAIMQDQTKRDIEFARLGMKQTEEGGEIISREDERNGAFLESLSQLTSMVAELQASANMPKRILKDENGEIYGTAPMPPEMIN